jgi:hypothetical protein
MDYERNANVGTGPRTWADWLFMAFCFFVGAAIGALIGFNLWVQAWWPGILDGWLSAVLSIGIPALFCGVCGAMKGK